MKLMRPHRLNPGDATRVEIEQDIVGEIKFKIFKNNNRTRPQNKKKVLLISCFSEFGCESISLLYCIPKIIATYPGAYVIAVGWFGREYLYRHLVDEYWELPEEYQWLREYSKAFENSSRNIVKIEASLAEQGQLFPGSYMGYICLGNKCKKCGFYYGSEDRNSVCPSCQNNEIERSPFAEIAKARLSMVPIPKPKINVDQYLKPNSVGIFARNRVCWGRNLPPEFYVQLIEKLESFGYNPIWLGEKQSTLPCPVDRILDFSRLPEAKNLEITLAIIGQLEFTIQFWTASTRLASMMGTPWILLESPDQILGKLIGKEGQEGIRIALTTDLNKKKLVISEFLNFLEDQEAGLKLVEQAIQEVKNNQWNDLVGLVKDPPEMTEWLKYRWRQLL